MGAMDECRIAPSEQLNNNILEWYIVYTRDIRVISEEFLAQARKRFGEELDGEGIHIIYPIDHRWIDSINRFSFIFI